MTRNLKNLAVAFTLIAAIYVAAAAPAAMAHSFRTSNGGEAHLTAEALGAYTIKATAEDDSEIKCNKYTIESTFKDGATEITVAPTFSECTYRFGETTGVAFIDTTGCHFRISAETTTGNPTGGEHASAEIKCTSAEAKHLDTKVTALKLLCRTVPPQQSAHAVRFVNDVTEGGVKDIIGESTIHDGVSTTPNTVACPTKSGKPEVHETGIVVGSVRVKGFKDAAKTQPTDIFVE
jgi:hypothetical protein